ncbi:MAG: CotH kinase family protein [Clostridia bacterium]
MKSRLITLAAVVLMLAVTLAVQSYSPDTYRYHQHREALPYTPCEDHGDEQFCTHLPLFNIVTEGPIPDPYLSDETGAHLKTANGSTVTNDEMVAASVEFFTNEEGNNHLTDEPDVSEKGMIRVRGKSSRQFDKKGYLLKFSKEDGIESLDVSLDGMAEASNWVLHGPILDKTLLRNYMCYNITGEEMKYVPNVRFCELFLNGEYQGVYVLTEKIDYNREGRCDITKTDPDLSETSFILRLNIGDGDPEHLLHTFFDYNDSRGLSNRPNAHFEIVYPDKTLTAAQKEYIASEISDLEKAMSSFDSADPKLGYPAYLDVDSFVDYYIFNEFMMNADAGNFSTYFCKDVRGKVTIIGWDYNNTFDNYTVDLQPDGEFIFSNDWYLWLMRDKRFVDQVVNRYYDLRETVLSDEYLENYIDETIEYLGPAIERNYERWGYTFTEEYNAANPGIVLSPIERNPSDYDEAIAQLKETIELRGAFLDDNIELLYTRCHSSVNKKYNYQTGK